MMARMMMVGQPGQVGRHTDQQIAQQSTWTRIPESKRLAASMHVIHIVPSNASTLTYVNPVDPGDECYYEPPVGWDKVTKAWKM